jgi:hypothetical protein
MWVSPATGSGLCNLHAPPAGARIEKPPAIPWCFERHPVATTHRLRSIQVLGFLLRLSHGREGILIRPASESTASRIMRHVKSGAVDTLPSPKTVSESVPLL